MKIILSWKTKDYYDNECLHSYTFSLLEIKQALNFIKLRKSYGKTFIRLGI